MVEHSITENSEENEADMRQTEIALLEAERGLGKNKYLTQRMQAEARGVEEGSLYAEDIKGKKLKQKKIEGEKFDRGEIDAVAKENEEGKRKLKGKRRKQKHRLKKNGKEEEKERIGDTLQEEEDVGMGECKGKQKDKGEKTVDEDALKAMKLRQMRQASRTRSMFADGFEERRDLEQYFWSEKTVLQLMRALQPTAWHSQHGHVCCLAAPSLAHAFYAMQGRAEALLDIDGRFEYLPGFRFFDLCNPVSSDSDEFRIVVFDPPFFYIPLPVLFQAVLVVVHGNLQAKLLVGFLQREEGSFLQTFAPFHLRRTRFVLEYATVKPNKWRNYALYANIDLPGIKRIV